MKMLKEFKEFAVKGNMLDLAIGVVLGAAFGKIVESLVNDLITPPIGLLNRSDLTDMFIVLAPGNDGQTVYDTLAKAKEAGAVTLNYGAFLSVLINFVLIAFALFIVVKAINTMRRRLVAEEAAAPPPAPNRSEQLLAEIRDAIKELPLQKT